MMFRVITSTFLLLLVLSLSIQIFTTVNTPHLNKDSICQSLKKKKKKGAVLAEMHVRTWMRILVTCVNSNSYT